MTLDQRIKETKEKGLGIVLGSLMGAGMGFLEAAVLPSYAISQITKDERYPAYDAIWPGNDFPNGTKEYLQTTMVIREVTRFGIMFGMGLDFSDKNADTVGYLVIPMAVSALYEMYRTARKQYEVLTRVG